MEERHTEAPIFQVTSDLDMLEVCISKGEDRQNG